MTELTEIDISRWLEAQAKELPIGLILHRELWRLAARSLREINQWKEGRRRREATK